MGHLLYVIIIVIVIVIIINLSYTHQLVKF